MIQVSVIMASHNSARFITEAIDSVRNQTYPNWELIIVDDQSTDDTVSIIRKYAELDARIKIITLSTKGGAGVARNIATERAKGRFIAFLDSDDIWLPHKLHRQTEFMLASAAPFTYGWYERISETGQHMSTETAPTRVAYAELLCGNVIGCLTAMYDAAYFGKQYMSEEIVQGQDFALWLSLIKKSTFASGIPDVLAKYRVRSNSLSAKKLTSSLWVWRIYRDKERLPLAKTVKCFARYALGGVIKRLRSKYLGTEQRTPRASVS
jgi:glycosyltransferase involved in cell wall biosynthesis